MGALGRKEFSWSQSAPCTTAVMSECVVVEMARMPTAVVFMAILAFHVWKSLVIHGKVSSIG